MQEHPTCSIGIHVKVLHFDVNTSVRCWMHWDSTLEVFSFYISKKDYEGYCMVSLTIAQMYVARQTLLLLHPLIMMV